MALAWTVKSQEKASKLQYTGHPSLSTSSLHQVS